MLIIFLISKQTYILQNTKNYFSKLFENTLQIEFCFIFIFSFFNFVLEV